MRRAVLALLLAASVPAAAGCSKVASLGRLGSEPLASGEAEAVRAQVARAREAKEWKVAWNQEVAAGADRATLEAVALDALADDDGDAEDMFRELVAGGALSPAARARIAVIRQKAEAERDWDRAAEVEILTAEDAPEYRAAWEVYRRTPVKDAPSVLEVITEARREHREDAKAAGEGQGG